MDFFFKKSATISIGSKGHREVSDTTLSCGDFQKLTEIKILVQQMLIKEDYLFGIIIPLLVKLSPNNQFLTSQQR